MIMFSCLMVYAVICLFKEKPFNENIPCYIPFIIVELMLLDFPIWELINEVLK